MNDYSKLEIVLVRYSLRESDDYRTQMRDVGKTLDEDG